MTGRFAPYDGCGTTVFELVELDEADCVVLPPHWEHIETDPTARRLADDLARRAAEAGKPLRPRVSFCGVAPRRDGARRTLRIMAGRLRGRDIREGWARAKTCEALVADPRVDTDFVFRTTFWAGALRSDGSSDYGAMRASRVEYADNVLSSDYVVCARGGGNFSYGLYETLSAGRTPVFVDTDLRAPIRARDRLAIAVRVGRRGGDLVGERPARRVPRAAHGRGVPRAAPQVPGGLRALPFAQGLLRSGGDRAMGVANLMRGAGQGSSLPVIHGRRGGGLGNEIIPWAKAYLGARELGLTCLHPAWALNPRGYRRDFGTSRFDWLAQRALRSALPTIEITREMVLSTGEDDCALAVRALAPSLALDRPRPTVVLHSGMGGGYFAIRRARRFLLRELMRPSHVVDDLYRIQHVIDDGRPVVALHVRRGDFGNPSLPPRPGEFNRSVPVGGYADVVDNLGAELGGSAQFLVFTDDPGGESVRELLRRPDVALPPARQRPVLSDAVAMASADALVCSVSSLSMLAAFLSEQPYIWFEPHLSHHGDGWRSLWGADAEEQRTTSLTRRNLASARLQPQDTVGRGFALGPSQHVPRRLVELIESRVAARRPTSNPIYQGVIHAPADGPAT